MQPLPPAMWINQKSKIVSPSLEERSTVEMKAVSLVDRPTVETTLQFDFDDFALEEISFPILLRQQLQNSNAMTSKNNPFKREITKNPNKEPTFKDMLINETPTTQLDLNTINQLLEESDEEETSEEELFDFADLLDSVENTDP